MRALPTHHSYGARLLELLGFTLTASDFFQGERQSRDTSSYSRPLSEATRVVCFPRLQKLSAEPRPPPLETPFITSITFVINMARTCTSMPYILLLHDTVGRGRGLPSLRLDRGGCVLIVLLPYKAGTEGC